MSSPDILFVPSLREEVQHRCALKRSQSAGVKSPEKVPCEISRETIMEIHPELMPVNLGSTSRKP